jgi:hypothetical protein
MTMSLESIFKRSGNWIFALGDACSLTRRLHPIPGTLDHDPIILISRLCVLRARANLGRGLGKSDWRIVGGSAGGAEKNAVQKLTCAVVAQGSATISANVAIAMFANRFDHEMGFRRLPWSHARHRFSFGVLVRIALWGIELLKPAGVAGIIGPHADQLARPLNRRKSGDR